jgi:Zn-dependent peptidase ImmA (M78 family)/transcriptional regulator with XRE-family HTH domain
VSARGFRVDLNPALLVWARESAGLSFADIARSVQVDPEVIEAWEKGEQQPTFRQLKLLANKVKRPLAALFLPTPPSEPPLPEDFRTLPGTTPNRFAPETLLAFRHARNIQQNTIELMETLGESPNVQVPGCSLNDNPEHFATEVRQRLGISVTTQLRWKDRYAALSAWRAAVEDTGVLVLQFSMPRRDARGFALTDRKAPVVAVTSKDAPEARVFSIFHEYCHLALGIGNVFNASALYSSSGRTSEKDRVEVFCNRFAAAFLLPKDAPEVQESLSSLATVLSLDHDRARVVARRFKVSKDVVLRRLHTLALISDSLYRKVAALWEREIAEDPPGGDGGPDYVTLRYSERGQRFSSLVLAALDRGEVSELEASDYLSVLPRHLDAIRERVYKGLNSG